jgi:hypothetical protein
VIAVDLFDEKLSQPERATGDTDATTGDREKFPKASQKE